MFDKVAEKFDRTVKHFEIEKQRFYASAISWFAFKNAELSQSKEERDMWLYKATRYGQVATRML